MLWLPVGKCPEETVPVALMAVSLMLQEAGGGVKDARLSRGPQGHSCDAHEWGGEVEQHRSSLVGWLLLAVGHVDDKGVVLA